MNMTRQLLRELQTSSRVAKSVEDMLLFLFWKVKVILENKVSAIKWPSQLLAQLPFCKFTALPEHSGKNVRKKLLL